MASWRDRVCVTLEMRGLEQMSAVGTWHERQSQLRISQDNNYQSSEAAQKRTGRGCGRPCPNEKLGEGPGELISKAYAPDIFANQAISAASGQCFARAAASSISETSFEVADGRRSRQRQGSDTASCACPSFSIVSTVLDKAAGDSVLSRIALRHPSHYST